MDPQDKAPPPSGSKIKPKYGFQIPQFHSLPLHMSASFLARSEAASRMCSKPVESFLSWRSLCVESAKSEPSKAQLR